MRAGLRRPLVAAALIFPATPAAIAVGIGDLVLSSHWGEAIEATVPLTPSPGEQLSEACLSLARPPANAGDGAFYLTRARLSLVQERSGAFVRITGRNLWREPVAKVVLRVGCGDGPAVQREFTLLLELPTPPARIDADPAPARPDSLAAETGAPWPVRPGDTLYAVARSVHPDDPRAQKALVAAIVKANPERFPGGRPANLVPGTMLVIPDLEAAVAARTRPPAPPALRISPAMDVPGGSRAGAGAATTPPLPSSAGSFQLRLTAEPVDLSRLGSVTEKERSLLRERQRLMEADDQTARFLELRHRITELEREIDRVRREPQRSVPPPAPKPTGDVFLSTQRRELAAHALNLYLLPAAQITLAALALFFVIRHYRNIRERLAARGLLFRRPGSARRPVLVESPRIADPLTPFDRDLAIATAGKEVRDWDPANMDAILHDAQLFVAHGHADKAADLLEEQIAAQRGELRVWMLLFVVYRSQGMRDRYGKLAKRFRDLAPDPQTWKGIQDLGREIDPGNPLYGEGQVRPPRSARGAPDAPVIAADPVPLDLSDTLTRPAAAVPGPAVGQGSATGPIGTG